MSKTPKIGDLQVWWIPQIGACQPFHAPVANIEQAALLLDTLAQYDLFQLENNIKPDFCNAGGLLVYEADNGDGVPGWSDWYNDDGEDIDDVIQAMREGGAA